MGESENKKVAFNMVIDRNRAIIINVLLNAASLDHNIKQGVNQALASHNIDMDRDFLEEFQQKYHECGFCTDPNCDYSEDEEED